jgi:hypothetical protein
MALLNYTTKIPAEQTISEIQRMLTKHDVSAMMTEYDGPHVSSVSFQIKMNAKPIGFRLPCNWHAVLEVLKKDARAKSRGFANEPRAIKTAWRIIFEWVRAQLALVEVNMVTVPQVFLPYAIMKDGRTLSEYVESNPEFLLGDGK